MYYSTWNRSILRKMQKRCFFFNLINWLRSTLLGQKLQDLATLFLKKVARMKKLQEMCCTVLWMFFFNVLMIAINMMEESSMLMFLECKHGHVLKLKSVKWHNCYYRHWCIKGRYRTWSRWWYRSAHYNQRIGWIKKCHLTLQYFDSLFFCLNSCFSA